MIQLSSDKLHKLPREVKDRVNAGVYSVYSIEPPAANPRATHVLLTKSPEYYLLDDDGGVVKSDDVRELSDLKFKGSFSFEDIDTGPVLKINCA